jgi:hypothetical protein
LLKVALSTNKIKSNPFPTFCCNIIGSLENLYKGE